MEWHKDLLGNKIFITTSTGLPPYVALKPLITTNSDRLYYAAHDMNLIIKALQQAVAEIEGKDKQT